MQSGAQLLSYQPAKHCEVLCYGHDQGLLQTRQLILQRRGWRPVIATDLAGFQKSLENNCPRVAVLCQTLGAEEIELALEVAAVHCPGTRSVVMLRTGDLEVFDEKAVLFDCKKGPEAFVQTVSALVAAGGNHPGQTITTPAASA